MRQIYRADGSECMGDDHGRRVIGYFTSWRTGKNGLPSYLVGDIPWDKITHINYAFAAVDEQPEIAKTMAAVNSSIVRRAQGKNWDINYQSVINQTEW